MEAERRNITVMFCDLVGSTALSDNLDPEELHEVVQAYQEVCADEIERLEGYIAQYLGDGILVYFGYPITHEDESQRAVQAGLNIISGIESFNLQLKKEKGFEIGVRIGIHTGLVVMADIGRGSRVERLALGITPNVAARVESVAQSNTVAISEPTFKSVKKFFECEDLGEHELKGLPLKMRVYRPLLVKPEVWSQSWEQKAINVGRSDKLEVLLSKWATVGQGKPASVLITGEAGIGKTHLFRAFLQSLQDTSQLVFYGQCSPSHRNVAYYPLLGLFHNLLKGELNLASLESWLSEFPFDPQEAVPLMASLLSIPTENRYPEISLSPKLLASKTLELVTGILETHSQKQPSILVIEDLQWADPSSLQLIAGLLKTDVPTFYIFTSRSEKTSQAIDVHMSQINLLPLSNDEVILLSEHLVQGKNLPDNINDKLVTQTGGIPLFIEELVQLILESGILKEGSKGYELIGKASEVTIPVSLKDLINAKLDQLGPAKEIIQMAAVFGREFSVDLMETISGETSEHVFEHLKRSVDAGLLLIKGEHPYYVFLFKHALLQEEAYNLLLKSKRIIYHLNIANTLEHDFPEYAEESPDFMAHHLHHAGENERAVSYWQKAGDMALRKSSNREAIDFLNHGLRLLESLPKSLERDQTELLLQSGLAPALLTTHGYTHKSVASAYNRAHELCQNAGDMPQLATILRGLWTHFLVGSHHQKAAEVAENLNHVASKTDDILIHFEAAKAVAGTHYWTGDFAAADAALRPVLQDFDPDIHYKHIYLFSDHPAVGGFCYWALTLAIMGQRAESDRKIALAITYARKLQHPFSMVYALSFASIRALLLGDYPSVVSYGKEGLELASKYGFAFWQGLNTITLGCGALADKKVTKEQLESLRNSIEGLRQTGATLWTSHPSGLLALAYGNINESEKGVKLIEQTIKQVEDQQEQFFEAELHRIRSLLLSQQQAGTTAVRKARALASKVAKEQQAGLFADRLSNS